MMGRACLAPCVGRWSVWLVLVSSIAALAANSVVAAVAGAPSLINDFAGAVKCQAHYAFYPHNTAEVSQLVQEAANASARGDKVTVRVSRQEFHSSNRSPCPDSPSGGVGWQVFVTNLTQVFEVDTHRSMVRVGAGMLLSDFLTLLTQNNMSLPVLSAPIYSQLCLGAVVANEAHGSNMRGPGIFADLVINATWVDGLGNVRSGSDLSLIGGAMGLTGILTELTIQAKPVTKTRIMQSRNSDEGLEAKVLPLVDAHASMMILWRPDHRRYYQTIFEEVPADTPSDGARHALFESTRKDLDNGVALVEFDQSDVFNEFNDDTLCAAVGDTEPRWFAVPGRMLDTNETAVGWSNDVSTGNCLHPELCIWKAVRFVLREMTLDLADLPAFLADVRALAGTLTGCLPYGLGLWMRFVRGSPYVMGYAYGRDSVYIEVATAQSNNYTFANIPLKHQAFYEELEQLAFCKYKARPHYGKSTNRNMLSPGGCSLIDTLPKFNEFQEERKKVDPYNVFMSDTFARIANRSGPVYYPGCAIAQDCYCQTDEHCNLPSDNNTVTYQCLPGTLWPQYKVCRPQALGSSYMLGMFIPALVVSHLLVALWMLQLLALYSPHLLYRYAPWLLRFLSRPVRTSNTGGSDLPIGCEPHGKEMVAKGSLLPVLQRVTLAWQDVGCVYSGPGGNKRQALTGIHGRALPCEMLALMGPSGAGKSTLLDILALRRVGGAVEGTVQVNGLPRNRATFYRQASYVSQEFAFIPTLTVAETVAFSANLLLPPGVTAADAKSLQEAALHAMGLGLHGQQLVGGALQGGVTLRGLSGGERRRLAIACQIVGSHPLLQLDEPTSGLDAGGALSVMTYLSSLARKGHTVMASIHQPRAEIWRLFDKVLLIAKGRMMYFGPPAGVQAWFTGRPGAGPDAAQGLGYHYDPALHGSVADWALDLVSLRSFAGKEDSDTNLDLQQLTNEHQLHEAADAFLAHYLQACKATNNGYLAADKPQAVQLHQGRSSSGSASSSPTYGQGVTGLSPDPAGGDQAVVVISDADPVASQDNNCSQATNNARSSDADAPAVLGRPSFFQQFKVLAWREWLSMTRNPADAAGRLLTIVWVGILSGLVFWDLDPSGRSYTARLALMFYELVILTCLPFVAMSIFMADRTFFITESAMDLYRPGAYYLAKVVVATPLFVVNAACFVLVLYGMSGLRDSGTAFAEHLLVAILVHLLFTQILHIAAVVASSQDLAYMGAVTANAINLLFSNYLMPIDNMTLAVPVGWARWVSVVFYCFCGMVRAEFSNRRFYCPFPEGFGDTGPCIIKGNKVVDWFGPVAFWPCVGALVGYLILLHVATYVAHVLLARKQRQCRL